MIFLALSGKMVFLFPENMTFFLRWKTKEGLFQKICVNMMFSVYSMKTVFLFPTNVKLPFFQKSKDDLLPKKYA